MITLRAERQAVAALTATQAVRRWILAACCLASAAKLLEPPMWVFDPPLERPFGAAWSDYRLLSSLAGVATVAFLLGGGILGDLYGRRRLLVIGLSGYLAGNLLLMMSPGAGWHAFSRYVALACGSLAAPLALAIINLVFFHRGRLVALACFAITNILASQLAWVQGKFFASVLGWRAPYALPIIVAALATVLAVRYVPETHSGRGRLMDTVVYMGWTLLVLAGLYGLFGLPLAGTYWGLLVGVTLLVGIFGVALVAWWDRRTRGAGRRNWRFRTRDLTALIITGVLINFVLIGYGIRTLAYFQIEKGFNILVALLGLAPILVGAILALYNFSRVVRKRQARAVIAAGLLAMALAIAFTALLPAQAPYLLYAAPLVVFGAGYLVAATVWMSAFLRTSVDGYYGLNASINQATGLIGGALGAVVTGNLLAKIGNASYSTFLRAELPAVQVAAIAALNDLLAANPVNIPEIVTQVQRDLAAGYLDAYAFAYDCVLWITALVCALCALVIGLGLRHSISAEQGGQAAVEEIPGTAE